MSAIHKLSSIKPLGEFDIFSVPPTQTTIEEDLFTEHRPVSTLDSRAFIEFNVSSGIDEYIRLDKTWLYLKLRINIQKPLKADVTADDWKKISTVNNLLNSLFKQIDLTIGDRVITPPHQTYAYKTDFEIKLGKSRESKETLLTSSFWFENSDTKGNNLNGKISQLISAETSEDQFKGKEIDLMGKIHLSLLEQPKALLGGCTIKLKFIPNDPAFYIMASPEVRLTSVEFTDCSLLVHRSKIARAVLEGHLKGLEISNAKYQLRESFVIPITINKGTMDRTLDNIHNGQLPKRAFVAFVDHNAFNGALLLNPFNYENFDLCHLAFHLNGKQYPDKPFAPDFGKDLYVRAFVSLFDSTNQDDVDSCITLDRWSYKEGNNIIAVNFAPDLSSGCCATGYVNPIKFGSIRLSIRFKTPLDKAITALVYLDYDTILEINKDRNPILEFN